MDITWSGILGPDPSGCEVTLVDNGSDWGARINAADVALGAKAGAICCQGGGNIASQIILNSGASSLRTLRFGAEMWTNSNTAETILPHDNTLIEGHGWDTILQEPAGNITMPIPGTPTLVASTTGGTLTTGTYYYKVTALDGLNESTPSGEGSVAVTGPTGKVVVTWASSVSGGVEAAVHYKVYRGTSSGAENVYYLVAQTGSVTTESMTDTGATATSGTPPSTNTALVSTVLSYFLVRPYATSLDGAAQVNNISMRNIQLLGVPGKAHNASSSTVNTGLLNGGVYENIWFNKTTSIGLSVGETNDHNFATPCRNVTVRRCKFTNVGGGTPPDYPAGGGVSFAILDGDHITLDSCTFIDALGNTVIDIEPNSAFDFCTNITISNNLLLQDGSTGVYEPNTYGIVTHAGGGPMGPIMIANNVIQGNYYNSIDYGFGAGPVGYQANNNFIVGIYIGYGTKDHDVTIQNNVIRYTSSYPIVIDGDSYNIVVDSNTCWEMLTNFVVVGHSCTIKNNKIANDSSEAAYFFGIEERGAASDNNTFTNNQATGCAQQNGAFVEAPATIVANNGADLVPVLIVGAHSTGSGNVKIARPSFPPLPSGW